VKVNATESVIQHNEISKYQSGVMKMQVERPRWFDGTINVPTILSVLIAGVSVAYFCVGLYNSLDRRVMTLEASDRAQEQHFNRIESDQSQLRNDMKEQLKSIGSDVKELSNKLDQWKDQMINSGNAPGIRRWTR
jgi:hypothetical protein